MKNNKSWSNYNNKNNKAKNSYNHRDKKCSNCNGNQTITINVVKQTELEKLRDRDRYNRECAEAEERDRKEWENSIEGRAYRQRERLEDMLSSLGW